MLDLDSPRWKEIPASCGMSSALTVKLLRQVREGNDTAYDELYHQVCHQFSVGAVAYVAVPHLVEIARTSALGRRVRPLSIVGTVQAARLAYPHDAPPLREEWTAEYLAANEEARRLTADALREDIWEPSDVQELLATLAALHGQVNLAMLLFLQGGVTELSCPMCGESIEYDESGK
jgi:hypothetical protein